MTDPVLDLGDYAAGVVWLAVVGVSLAGAARRVARRWFAAWSPAAALLGQLVVALALFTSVGQVLGGIGQLRALPVAAATVAAGAAIGLVAGRGPARVAEPPSAVASPRGERLLAAGAVAAVGAQWVAHTTSSLGTGMTHADTLWYHGPFTARFLQMASLGELGDLGYSQARYYPLGSELLHALVALPFDRDLLSPVVNLAFGALALLSVAVIGTRWGVGALAVLGTAAVLALPTLAGTQPGQASNDVVAVGLVLAAVALVTHGARSVSGMVVAGLALGLAAGTKMTVLALCGPVGLLVLATTWRAGRRAAAAGWTAGILVPSLFWPVRNVALAGTPVPFLDFEVAGWHHAARTSTSGTPSLVEVLFTNTGWSYRTGIANGFGRAWPVVLLLLAGPLLVAWRGPAALRSTAVATIVAALAYPFTPFTGASSFQYNLRYLTPVLAVSTVLLVVVSRREEKVRLGVTVLLSVVVVTALAAPHHERVDAWPGHPALAAGTALAILGVGLLARRGAGRVAAGRAAAAVALAAAVAGWPLQARYLERRYVDADLHDDAVHALLQPYSGQRVEVLGTPETYPMFGADLSNTVDGHDDELVLDAPAPDDPCRFWRRTLHDADLIVISTFGFVMRPFSPEDRRVIFEDDPAVSVVYSDPDRALYRVTGALDEGAC